MVTIVWALYSVNNHKKAPNDKIWVIFSPIGKLFTVAYKVSHFEMMRLYLNVEDSLSSSFFV